MEVILQNTAQLAAQPNLLEKFKTLPDSQLRLIVGAISAVLVGIGWYLTGTPPWFPLLIALSTVVSTPKIKEVYLKTNKWLNLLSALVLSCTLVVFPLIPQWAIGVVLTIGNIPMFLDISSKRRADLNKRLGIKAPKPVKTKPVKVAKDPATRTNTQKKRDAWLAKQTKKKG